jgi:hypothetical protein
LGAAVGFFAVTGWVFFEEEAGSGCDVFGISGGMLEAGGGQITPSSKPGEGDKHDDQVSGMERTVNAETGCPGNGLGRIVPATFLWMVGAGGTPALLDGCPVRSVVLPEGFCPGFGRLGGGRGRFDRVGERAGLLPVDFGMLPGVFRHAPQPVCPASWACCRAPQACCRASGVICLTPRAFCRASGAGCRAPQVIWCASRVFCPARQVCCPASVPA